MQSHLQEAVLSLNRGQHGRKVGMAQAVWWGVWLLALHRTGAWGYTQSAERWSSPRPRAVPSNLEVCCGGVRFVRSVGN